MITKYLSSNDKKLIADLLEKEIEVCGHVYKKNSSFVLFVESFGKALSNRGTCQHKTYSNIIWHTHPKNTKGYPSMEDIRKILKTQSIQVSVIFTTWGVWELSAKNKNPVSKSLENQIKNIGDKLYFKTEKGRKLPKGSKGNAIISNYISSLISICEDYELSILFYLLL